MQDVQSGIMMNLKAKKPVSIFFQSDKQFNRLYPAPIRLLSARHWTPLAVAREASAFLAAESGKRILDIGSGVGKFCLGAAYYYPDAFYYGVEQRKDLVSYAQAAAVTLGLKNVSFVHNNFTQVGLNEFDHFYFYNAFYENLKGTEKIDHKITHSDQLYHVYRSHLFRQLEQMPAGTRVATYYGYEDELPPAYHVVGTAMDNLLKFWIKI